jgi:hypothetical protein
MLLESSITWPAILMEKDDESCIISTKAEDRFLQY